MLQTKILTKREIESEKRKGENNNQTNNNNNNKTCTMYSKQEEKCH